MKCKGSNKVQRSKGNMCECNNKVQSVKVAISVNITTNMGVVTRCKGTRATCAKAIVRCEGTKRHKINNKV